MNRVILIMFFVICVFLIVKGVDNLIMNTLILFIENTPFSANLISFVRVGGFAILMICIGVFGIFKIKNTESGSEMFNSIKMKLKNNFFKK
jgi:hypothetical protein